MNWTVIFEAPAQAEIAEAFAWYEDKSYGLGGDFLRVIAAASEQLARNPEAYPSTQLRFRQILLRRFPYALHFELLSGQQVSVLAWQREGKLASFWLTLPVSCRMIA